MKKTLVMIALFLSVSCFADAQKVTVGINGMTCMGCVNSIKAQFKGLPQVASIEVDLETKKATVTLKEGQTIDSSLEIK